MYHSQNYNFTGGGNTTPPKQEQGAFKQDDEQPARLKVTGNASDVEAVVREQCFGETLLTTVFSVDAETGQSSSVVILAPQGEQLPDLNIGILMMAHCAGLLRNAASCLPEGDAAGVKIAIEKLTTVASAITEREKRKQ